MILNTGYEAIISGLSATFAAQIFKLFTNYFRNKVFDFTMLTTTGGMPSSHASGVVALSTSIALIDGLSSTTFAVSAGFALVVLQDAAGLRQASGEMAACLNQIVAELHKFKIKMAGQRFKEMLGHTPFEVFAGVIWGICAAFILRFVVLS